MAPILPPTPQTITRHRLAKLVVIMECAAIFVSAFFEYYYIDFLRRDTTLIVGSLGVNRDRDSGVVSFLFGTDDDE